MLRLFVALNFDWTVKARLYHLEELVKSQALQGNFTLPENLHLTLAFLGEVPAGRLGEVRAILKQVPFAPVKLEISGCGAFGSRGCDRSGLKEQLLWWALLECRGWSGYMICWSGVLSWHSCQWTRNRLCLTLPWRDAACSRRIFRGRRR